MSSSNGQSVLLLADDGVAAELATRWSPSNFFRCNDAYAALQELADKPYSAVVLTHPRQDFASLVAAAHKVRSSARVYALTSPAGEAELHGSGDDAALTDYFIYPPTPADMQRILTPPSAAAPVAPAPAPLSVEQIAELIRAAQSARSLQEKSAAMVEALLGVKVRWLAQAAAPAGRPPLLRMEIEAPLVLLEEKVAEITPPARAGLDALQELLAALAAQVKNLEMMHRLAITDHLTGAYNRRYFYLFTDQLLSRARAERFRVTLLLFDIDDFKRYNDNYSHAVGDEILRETARLLKQVTREQDVVARIGGDEFAVLFWDAEPPRRPDSQHPATAAALTQRFVAALKRHEFACLGPEAKGMLTVSGGLATFPWDGQDCRELLRHADKGLRQVKTSGKDSIYLVGRQERDEPTSAW